MNSKKSSSIAPVTTESISLFRKTAKGGANMQIGAQMYTVRDLCQDQKGLDKALERVVAIGYKCVQLSGFPYDPAHTKAVCDALGLTIALTHNDPQCLANNIDALIQVHQIMDCVNIGLGCLPVRGIQNGHAYAASLAPSLEKLKTAGMRFQYHNHAFEFAREGTGSLWDALVQETDPDVWGFTLDTYWVHYGGLDICDTITALNGRLQVCHLKDWTIADGEPRFAPVGAGNFNWRKILRAFLEAGTQYAFVEQDVCYGEAPMDALARSYRFLASLAPELGFQA
jgi:sugar phosphate isomerase/epimerase